MKRLRLSEPIRPLLFVALVLSIPAFYLDLIGSPSGLIPVSVLAYHNAGSMLYVLMALILALDLILRSRSAAGVAILWRKPTLDTFIFLGALVSILPTETPWSLGVWVLRLGFSGLVFLRLATFIARWVVPKRMLLILMLSAGLLTVSGAGFYLLEPKVTSFGDGMWLAFTTAATVGYGDLVPTEPASRIFAIFIVLFGYAVFSFVTASIAALFVGEDEKRLERELHADIRSLREEVAQLRKELLRRNR